MADAIQSNSNTTNLPSTLPALLASQSRDSAFLHCTDRGWTYGEFSDAAAQLAAGLIASGIGHGDRVAIAGLNSAEWLITWHATARIGAILVTLNVSYREREFEYMLNQSGAVMLVCEASDGDFDFVSFLDRLRPKLPLVDHYIFVGGDGFEGSRRWDQVLTLGGDADELTTAEANVSPDDPAVILYTSGTTGDPKGATLTHRSIIASGLAQAHHLDQTADDVSIGHMPLNHVGGMTCTVTASMTVGGKVALLPRYSPKLALQTIATTGVTIFIGVPTMYRMMMALPEFHSTDTSTVRLCIVGGSNVEPATGRQILASFEGIRLANLYGLSETSGGCIISPKGEDLENLVETLGVAIGDFDAHIADLDGNILGPDQEGELIIRGNCVAAGYWEKPEDTAEAFRPDGWLATGDMAIKRSDGRIVLRGRRKEMYVRGGYNVYPVEVENVIAQDESVAMCAVIGVPDEMHGEVGLAFVVAKPGAELDTDALLRRCTSSLAKYKVPSEIRQVESLPLTPAGKIRKVALRQ